MISLKRTISHAQCETSAGYDVHVNSLGDKVSFLILRDLTRLGWNINYRKDRIEILPPDNYDKSTIREAMSIKRSEINQKNNDWIRMHIDLARANLARGQDVLKSRIEPIVEECTTSAQHALFRVFRYYWSSPYSEYVGRRIKLIVRDNALPNRPVIGIAALGSPIIHIPERDEWIGWDKETRTNHLNFTMDAYVIGALPPYNHLLGGKLISYLLASNEVRHIYESKYKDRKSLISGKCYNTLAGIFTTSLYGRSSQYNRLKYDDKLLYTPIGKTKGFGSLHLSDETINSMQEFLIEKGIYVGNRFGDGPSWKIRVIRTAGETLGIDTRVLLNHSFNRNIYFVPFAENSLKFLNGGSQKLRHFDYSAEKLVSFWKKRWLSMRMKDENIFAKVASFSPMRFSIK